MAVAVVMAVDAKNVDIEGLSKKKDTSFVELLVVTNQTRGDEI